MSTEFFLLASSTPEGDAIKAPFWECDACGAVVADIVEHEAWHTEDFVDGDLHARVLAFKEKADRVVGEVQAELSAHTPDATRPSAVKARHEIRERLVAAEARSLAYGAVLALIVGDGN